MSRLPKLEPGQLLGGLIFSAVGLLVIGIAIFADDRFLAGPRWLGGVIGLAFLLTGLFILRAHTLWAGRFPTIDWGRIWGGSLAVLVGFTIAVFSFIDDDASFSAPRWVATCAGAAFLLAGILVFRGKPRPDSVLDSLLIALFLTCFGAVPTGLFLSPGDLVGEGYIETPFGGISVPLGKYVRFLIFMLGALILNGLALYGWGRVLKNLVRRFCQRD